MKKIQSCFLCALTLLLGNIVSILPSSAAEYSFTTFDELVDNSSLYHNGDLINIENNITSSRDIGDIFPSGGSYIINGSSSEFFGNNNKGFVVNKYTNLTFDDFSKVHNFKTNGNGGAFENNGILTLNNSIFDTNSAAKGGVVFNKGTLNINNSTFTNNGTLSTTTYGGAIRSEAGTLNITDSYFSNNQSKNYGGAIGTSNTIINITGSTFENNHTDGRGGVMSSNAYATVRNSTFKNNSSSSYGGVFNINNDLLVSNSLFEGNSTLEAGTTRFNGGAIRSETGNTLINNSTFKNNSASWGGAISTDHTANLVILNSIFEGNSSHISSVTNAGSSGGAVTNGSTLLIVNSVFKNNTASGRGGGINFNGSILNIVANGTGTYTQNGNSTGNTVFEGNTLKDGSSNGLQVYQGFDEVPIVNLNAGNGGTITFNDALVIGNHLDSDAASKPAITINVNKEIEYDDLAGHVYSSPTDGVVLFNNKVGGVTNSILNLHDGTLKIGDNGSFQNLSMNLQGGTIETRNNVSDVLDFNDFNIIKDTNWRMDVDLAAGKSDYLNISGTATAADNASLIIETIRLTSDFDFADRVENNTKYIYFSNKHLGSSAIASMAYDQTILTYVTTNSTYNVSTGYDSSGSKFGFTYKGQGGLPYAVSKDGIRIYSGTGDEKITGWIPSTGSDGNDTSNYLKGSKLIIWGNDYSVTNDSGTDLKGIVAGRDTVKNQTLEINDVKSWSGFSNSYSDIMKDGTVFVYGGAVAVIGGAGNLTTLNIDNSKFENNYVGTVDNPLYRSYGGAISISNSASTAFANILDSNFSNNSVMGRDAYGGAISVTLGNLHLSNTLFTANKAESVKIGTSNGMNAYGGAINLENENSRLFIENSGFSGNTVSSFESGGGYQRAYGGALYAGARTNTYIKGASFYRNRAEGYNAYGGAINNNGTMTISDSFFWNNYAQATGTAQGGAINNDGTLNIIASDDNTTFTGNYVEKVKRAADGTITSVSKDSQALYNTTTVNMNAKDGKSIIFHDKIAGSKGVLNINKSGISFSDFKNSYTAPTDGSVVFNNTVSNQTINLYNGILSIGNDTTSLAAGDKYFDNVSLNAYGGTFDIQNNQIDNITLNSLVLNGNMNLDLDVDLAAKISDFLTVNGNITGNGNLVIDAVKIIADMNAGTNTVDTQFINKSVTNAIVAEATKTVSTNDYIYNVSLINNNTALRFEKASASLGLPEAVAKPEITEFDMTRDELVAEWIDPTLNKMQGDLTIVGNRHSIIAENNLVGIDTNGKTLNIIEVGDIHSEVLNESMRNFDKALTNSNNGTINISHSVFSHNTAKNSYVDLEPPYTPGPDGEDITTQFVGGNGSVIQNNEGSVTIDGGIFYQNSAENLGGAIYNNDKLTMISSDGNRLIFEDNNALTAESMNTYANDIWQTASGRTTISGTGGLVYFGGGFAGDGIVVKEGSNNMELGSTSDSSKYKGDFILTDGFLTVNDGAVFFGGNSEVTGGNLNWDTKTKLVEGAKLAVNGGNVNVLSNGHMYLDDKTKINFSNVFVNIQEGGILENTTNLSLNGGVLNGYNDGKSTTYGTFKNSGILTLAGDNSIFKGTFLQTDGITTADGDAIMFANGDLQGGTIVFNDNSTIKSDSSFTSANSDGEKTIVMNNNTNTSSILGAVAKSDNKNLSIVISNTVDTIQTTKVDNLNLDEGIVSLTIIDNVTYEGDIKVSSGAELNLIAKTYDMHFNNNIVDLNDSSSLNITTDSGIGGLHSVTIGGNSVITGNANIDGGGIIKSGDGTFVLSGDASGFTGDFTQYEGKTEISTNGFVFNGNKNILGGELEINSNTGVYYSDVHLGSGAVLTHKSSIPEKGIITADTFDFTGAGATAEFTATADLTTMAKYNLGADIQNGSANTVSFENSKVTLGVDNFTGSTTYDFSNSTIDLINSSTDMKDYVFSKLNSNNTSIDLKIDFVNDGGTIKLATDTITVNGTDVNGGNAFDLGNVIIHDASLENGSGVYNTVKDVLQGDASFNDKAPSILVAEGATTIYEYELSLTDNNKSIKLNNIGAADENSLNKINIKDFNRFFNFSKGKDGQPEFYYNAKSLDEMGAGKFTVSGATNSSADSVLSGFLLERDYEGNPVITDTKGSLFNINDDSDFTIQNLTVQDTYKDGTGSVISIGTPDFVNSSAKADILNVVVQRAESTADGGALYNNGGTFNIIDSQFYENISDSDGGVMHNESGLVSIFGGIFGTEKRGNSAQNGAVLSTGENSNTQISHSSFSNNTAVQNGGVIYNKGSLTLTESNIFSNNTSQNGRGGAIYNDGNLTISSKTSSDTLFTDNNDSLGKNDIYQTSKAVTTINGDGGKIAVNSGFAGEGQIIKEGINELILGADSVNSSFTGDFTLKDGIATVNGDFFGGLSTLEGGILNWNTVAEKTQNAVLNAQGGSVVVNGKLTLNNASDSLSAGTQLNVSQNALLTVENGYVSFDKNGHDGDFANYDKWAGAVVQSGGVIDYDIDTNGLLQSTNGQLNLTGGNLTLADVEFNGQKYTSNISSQTDVKIDNGAMLTLDSSNASLTLNKGDEWAQDGTVTIKNGTLNYTDNIGNGKINAQGGAVNVVSSDLMLKHVDDVIAKDVHFSLDNNSVLGVSAGSVTLDSADSLHGVIKLTDSGNIIADGFVNNPNNSGLIYQQDGGKLTVNNNSNVFINNAQSHIKNGDVTVNNASLTIGGSVDGADYTNLNLQNNAVFNTGLALNVTDTLRMNNSYLSTINNSIENNTIENLVISSGSVANFGVDISGQNHVSDKFLISNITIDAYDGAVINLSNFNFTGAAPASRELTFQIFDTQNLSEKVAFAVTGNPVTTPIGQYKATSLGSGLFNFKLSSFNPQVFRGQVATMAAYQNQLLIDNIVLNHIMLVGHNLIASDDQNRYAATLPQFAPYQYSQKDGGIWYKSFMNLEKLDMSNNLRVGNNAYGSLIGMDFPVINLKRGWKFIPTAYIAYNGGHQHFNGVSMYQDGGQGGLMGTFVKNDFIGSVMAYGGGYGNTMSGQGYSDRTGNWFAGTAAKFAYNVNVSKHFTIQPTAFVSYNAFGQQNWNSQFGALSMNSGLLNGINTAPGVNFIYGRENWSVYATFQYMFNINDRITGKAGNVDLPTLTMEHGYIEYGIGATRRWKDRLNAYGQVTLRNGGRTGIGFQLGLQYMFDLSELKNIGNLFKRKT